MKIVLSARAWGQYVAWQADDPKTAARINVMIDDIMRSPFRGIGKPEPLRENWRGWWSRRIDDEHRLIYRVTGAGEDQRLEIAQCRYHY
ncbi:Txe/YoeB family addiction module toxin [Sphingomonas sp. SUN039]|uniref:Txe/YoeB family addiction module toxin n=1 Tax=Sphingomonas sp. SUN039 TaxID=2937787 RepID=UPI00216415FC|nr:Txe/YoeB family addiction module toxin [Sphingomonas sp. SUN039]UVO55628.1 Txe/YoeB family addiction module toxin [Sphingomonas sp. SUN039]